MHRILVRICEGKGREGDIETLEELSEVAMEASLCALGTSAPNPFLSTLRYFRDEYEAHISGKRCPAKSCKSLVSFWIDPAKCVGCTICARKCPSQGIDGEKKEIHVIDQNECDACGVCFEVCPSKYDAVVKISGEPVPDPVPVGERAIVEAASDE
jgi:NADH-quinone oxidoreductase subunit F